MRDFEVIDMAGLNQMALTQAGWNMRQLRNLLMAAGRQLADDMDAMAGWFMVEVTSGREDAVIAAMERAGLHAWVPMVLEPRCVETRRGRRNGRRTLRTDAVRVKAFSGYVAVRVVPSEQAFLAISLFNHVYRVVRYCGGAGGFDTLAELAHSALPAAVVAELQRREYAVLDLSTGSHLLFPCGSAVQVQSGPFQGLQGVVDDRKPLPGLVCVELSLFGRATRSQFMLDEVKLVA